ncbi:ribosomal protein N-acetyltransferase [Deinococcus metalli]|uniref:Ribosomal protein N-acetyltransferase n=2 Tax=Deinococcus metalli TaxID=1141878 RepID=A0ABQ3JRB5_9DEIO|nr:ribosomal protein N-acetyltransferase [Deinococcus metalli]
MLARMTPPTVPTEFRTPRLLLRAPRPQDARAQVEAVNASLPELRRWMVWAQEPQTLDGARENLAQAAEAYARRENLRLLVWTEDGTQLLGSTGYHALDWRVPKGEIGYWIATAHTGHGYAQEVAAFLTTYALDDLRFRRVEIRCDALNARSARIPRALGYTLDARLVNDDVAADDPTRLRDTLIYSLTQ